MNPPKNYEAEKKWWFGIVSGRACLEIVFRKNTSRSFTWAEARSCWHDSKSPSLFAAKQILSALNCVGICREILEVCTIFFKIPQGLNYIKDYFVLTPLCLFDIFSIRVVEWTCIWFLSLQACFIRPHYLTQNFANIWSAIKNYFFLCTHITYFLNWTIYAVINSSVVILINLRVV